MGRTDGDNLFCIFPCSKAVISFGFPIATRFACMHDCCFAFQRWPIYLLDCILFFGPACACFQRWPRFVRFLMIRWTLRRLFLRFNVYLPSIFWPRLIFRCFGTWEFDTFVWLFASSQFSSYHAWVLVDGRLCSTIIYRLSPRFLSLCGSKYVWSFCSVSPLGLLW